MYYILRSHFSHRSAIDCAIPAADFLSIVAIHKDFVDTLGSDTIAYSTVTLYLREAQFRPYNHPLPDEQIEAHNEINEVIMVVLAE
jgi:hypothetical protein